MTDQTRARALRAALAVLVLLGSAACQAPLVTPGDLEALQLRLEARAADVAQAQARALEEARAAQDAALRAAREEQAAALEQVAAERQAAVAAALDEHAARQSSTWSTWVADLRDGLAEKAGAAAGAVQAELERLVALEQERRAEQLERLRLEVASKVQADQVETERALERTARALEEAQRGALDRLRDEVRLDPAVVQRTVQEAMEPLAERVDAQDDLVASLQHQARTWIPEPWGELLAGAIATAAAGGLASRARKQAVEQAHRERDLRRMARGEPVESTTTTGRAA